MNQNSHIPKTLPATRGCYLLRPLFIFILSLSVICVRAQSIGNWTFNGSLAGTPGIFNTVSAADFSPGVPTHSFNGGTEYFGENGWPSGAINNLMYMQFSLSPAAGYQLDISTLVLRMRRSNTGSPAGSGPTAWSLRSNLDGYATDIAGGTITHNYADYTITPGAAFTNIYTSLIFRVYGYNASVGGGGTSRLVLDNIRVNGIGYLLPARLGELSCTVTNRKALLWYNVYHTGKNDKYLIERSADGIHFSTVGTTIEHQDGAEKKYAHTDDISGIPITGKLYYRIHLVGSNGNGAYSAMVAVTIKNSDAVLTSFTHNNQLHISGVLPAAGIYHVTLYSMGGQLMSRNIFAAVKGYNAHIIHLNTQTPVGCVIQVTGNDYTHTAFVPAQ